MPLKDDWVPGQTGLTEAVNDAASTVNAHEALVTTGRLSDPELTAKMDEQLDARWLTDVDSLVAVGDSLTASVGTDWPAGVASDLGMVGYNGGRGGWASTDIAILFGAVHPILTLSGGSIPSSGPVAVTAISPSSSYRTDDGALSFSYHGYAITPAGNVPGTYYRSGTKTTWTFTRDEAGVAIACPSGVTFVCTDMDARRDAVQTRWLSTRNNDFAGSVMADVVRDNDLLDRHATGRGLPTALILGPTWPSSYPRGHAKYTEIQGLVAAELQRYGSRFRNVWQWLIDNGLALANITPTSTDLTNLVNNVLPTSLRADVTHPNATGYGLIRQYVANELKGAGAAIGAIATRALTAVTGVAVGSATDTGFTVSWTAVTGATAYVVEVKAPSGSDWVYVGNTTGTSLAVATLAAATTYSVRVTAVNVAGRGAQSATATGATTSTPVVIASDSFNRANAGSLGTMDAALGGTGAAWSASQIGIVSNKAKRTANNTFAAYSTADVGVTDCRVKATVVALPDTGGDLGVVARADSTGYTSAYGLSVRPDGTPYLVRNSSPIWTGAAGTVVAGSVIELSVVGSTVKAIVDGVVRATVTDTAVTSGTRVGLRFPATLVPELDSLIVYDL